MRKTKINNNKALCELLCVLLCVLFLFAFVPSMTAHAANTTPPSVLSDLKKDKFFDVVKYPVKDKDYSLEVIQVAEGKGGVLYVYVYQPSGNLIADEIRMSTSANDETAKYSDYTLTLAAKEAPFFKYTVKGFKVASDDTRFYSVVQVSRPWIEDIDGKPQLENGNTVDNKVYPVGQTWIAETVNNAVTYSVVELRTVTVTDKYVGVLRYSTDEGLITGSTTQVFYVAFDTDIFMERLIEATISFDIVAINPIDNTVISTLKKDQVETVCADDVISVMYGTWWTEFKKHKFSAIQTSTDFIKSVTDSGDKLSDKVKSEISSKRWVVRFHADKFSYGFNDDWSISKPSAAQLAPSKTSILQITYETDGRAYNVGVVDDKRTSNGRTDNIHVDSGLPWWVWLIIGIVILMLIPILIFNFPAIISLFYKILKAIVIALVWLLKGLWWLLCLPFKGIAKLIRRKRNKP